MFLKYFTKPCRTKTCIFSLVDSRTNILLLAIDFLFSLVRAFNSLHFAKILCRDRPSERLGYAGNGWNDVRRHTWLQNFDWANLRSGNLHPFYIPEVRLNDVHNIVYEMCFYTAEMSWALT